MVFVVIQATNCQNAEEPPLDFGGSGDGPADLTAVASSADNAPIIDEEDNLDATMKLVDSIDSLNDHSTVKPDTPVLDEEIDKTLLTLAVDENLASNKSACDICTCNETTDGFVIDCSHKSLVEMPESIDEKTTVLNLEYNQLEKLPKSIGTLKNLIQLNANNNQLKEIEYGSVSMLSNLKTLNLANNKFTEIPQDLKNSFLLTALTNLTLSGNDITQISPETFSQFKSLKTIKLNNISEELTVELCNLVNITLEEVCKADSCKKCNYMFENEPVHPSLIAADNDYLEHPTTPAPSNMNATIIAPNVTKTLEATTEFSLKNAVDKEFHGRKAAEPPVETEKKKEDIKSEVDAKVGATTNNGESSGGVSTLIVGLVVAGMVLVVIIVVVKKNWSRITSSSSRPADRSGAPNGTTPEEVPLREKSNPV